MSGISKHFLKKRHFILIEWCRLNPKWDSRLFYFWRYPKDSYKWFMIEINIPVWRYLLHIYFKMNKRKDDTVY